MAHIPLLTIILIFSIIAVGIALFVVLGRRIGMQASKEDGSIARRKMMEANGQENLLKSIKRPPALPKNAIMMLNNSESVSYIQPELGSPLAIMLYEIQKKIPQFQIEAFLKQVDGCFRNVVTGFAEGNRAALVPVLAEDLLPMFDSVIEKRLRDGHQVHCHIQRLEKLEIINATMDEDVVEIEVAITSWQVNYQKDREKKLIEGTEGLTEFRDLWRFVYDSAHSTWRLKKTESF